MNAEDFWLFTREGFLKFQGRPPHFAVASASIIVSFRPTGPTGRRTRRHSEEQKNSRMFKFPAFLLPTSVGQPMHSPSALTEQVSLNLAGTFLLDPVHGI